MSSQLLAKVLLLLFLGSTPCVDAYECINTPPAPVHGKLSVPFGSVVARLMCPKGSDVPLNARREGLLECNPHQTPYGLRDVPRHQCLPLKIPNSLKIHLEFNYLVKICTYGNLHYLKHALEAKLPDINSYAAKQGLNATWLSPAIACGITELAVDGKVRRRVVAKATLQISPYNTRHDHTFFLKFIDGMKSGYFNNTSGPTAEAVWGFPGFELKYLMFSDLYSSCENQPQTVATSVDDHNIVSCRGCPRDYVLLSAFSRCRICTANFYTLGPFADACLPCPLESLWKESRDLYDKYCAKFQADYD